MIGCLLVLRSSGISLGVRPGPLDCDLSTELDVPGLDCETKARTNLTPPLGRFETRLCAVRLLSGFTIRLRPVDWTALTLLVSEVPSFLFSLDRANSVGAVEVVALSVLMYFALRLLPRTAFPAAWFAALVGLVGAWLGCIGINQFANGAAQLTAVRLTDLVAFRSRLIHPIPGWPQAF